MSLAEMLPRSARHVELRFATGPAAQPNRLGFEADGPLQAVRQVAHITWLVLARRGFLGVAPGDLIVRELPCGAARCPAILFCADAPEPGARVHSRVVAIVAEGLSLIELELGLAWWANQETAR